MKPAESKADWLLKAGPIAKRLNEESRFDNIHREAGAAEKAARHEHD